MQGCHHRLGACFEVAEELVEGNSAEGRILETGDLAASNETRAFTVDNKRLQLGMRLKCGEAVDQSLYGCARESVEGWILDDQHTNGALGLQLHGRRGHGVFDLSVGCNELRVLAGCLSCADWSECS